MAKKAKDKTGDSARRGNGFDPEVTKAFAQRVELLEAEKQILKDACKAECEPIASDIKLIVDEAEAAGIPKKAFKKVLAHRAAERKIEAQRRALDMMDQADYDNLRLALGDLRDTPLGQSSLRSAVRGLGTPVPLTDEEKAKGQTAAFIGKDGTRMSIGAGA